MENWKIVFIIIISYSFTFVDVIRDLIGGPPMKHALKHLREN